MTPTRPRRIWGLWRGGCALDVHTLSSIPIGYDQFGHVRSETIRSDVGNLLYGLKYSRQRTCLEPLVIAAADFVARWRPPVDAIVPIPPNSRRSEQPVPLIADGLAAAMGTPVANSVRQVRDVWQLKSVHDTDERLRLLEGLHEVAPGCFCGRRVLLPDDLYRSGATMNAIAKELHERGEAAEVYALVMTMTRSNR